MEPINAQASCADATDVTALNAGEAADRIIEGVEAIRDSEVVATLDALGRTVAEDIISSVNVPAHTNSAVDGYAVRHRNLPEDPAQPAAEFDIVATAWAGKPWAGTLANGQAARIMTGAKVPDGADTVIMQEHTERNGDRVRIGCDHREGQNIRKAGEDLALGEVAVGRGTRIDPAELGLIASLGLAEITVTRPLRVAFFSTGDELRHPGEPLGDGGIFDSNRYTLHGMLTRLGVELNDLGIVADRKEDLREAFLEASAIADVVITSGGVSVGDADYVREILGELGDVDFWKLAIKPGRPLAFGRLGDAAFFGLPGNPVAVMVTFYEFVQPALRRMMGQTRLRPARFEVTCSSRLRKKPGRMEFQRGLLSTGTDGRLTVERSGPQGSGILSSISMANCFIVLPTAAGTIEPGDQVVVEPFEGIV